jgi:transcriptional regulator with XRE-family HTH domain
MGDNKTMAKRRTNKMSDQLRQAIDDSRLSRYQIAALMEIDESALAKFYNGKRGLSMKALDRLAACLDLGLTMGGKPISKNKGS